MADSVIRIDRLDSLADRRNMARIRATEAELNAQGLTTHVTDARVGLDLTATVKPGRLREPEFWIDEESYAELRFWVPPDVTAPQLVDAVLRAIKVLTAIN